MNKTCTKFSSTWGKLIFFRPKWRQSSGNQTPNSISKFNRWNIFFDQSRLLINRKYDVKTGRNVHQLRCSYWESRLIELVWAVTRSQKLFISEKIILVTHDANEFWWHRHRHRHRLGNCVWNKCRKSYHAAFAQQRLCVSNCIDQTKLTLFTSRLETVDNSIWIGGCTMPHRLSGQQFTW